MNHQITSLGMAEKPENIFWSFSGRAFDHRRSSEDIFLDGVSGTDRPWKNLREESILCARAIHELPFKKKKILFSGGLDSEFMLSAFLEGGVVPEVVAIDFGYNQEELHYAEKFCRDHQISLLIHQFPTKKFWQNDLKAVAEKAGCISPSICALLGAILQLDEYLILGDGELDIFTHNGVRFYETRGERWAVARWLLQNKHPGCPSFFRYSSELEAAFVFDPMVEDFEKGWQTIDHRWFSSIKYFLYYHHFGLRWRPKMLGFKESEEWGNLEKSLRHELQSIHPMANSHCTMDFELMKKIKRNEIKFDQLLFHPIAELNFSAREKEYLNAHAKHGPHWIAFEYNRGDK